MLSLQLIRNAKCLGSSSLRFAPEDDSPLNIIPVGSITEPSSAGVSDLSSPDVASLSDKQIIRALQAANGKTHYLVKFDITKDPSGHCRCKKQKCKRCYETGIQKMSVSTTSAVVKATATAAKAMTETASSIMWNKSGVKQGTATTHLSLFICLFIFFEFSHSCKK
jgi:hypothetical protein